MKKHGGSGIMYNDERGKVVKCSTCGREQRVFDDYPANYMFLECPYCPDFVNKANGKLGVMRSAKASVNNETPD